MLNALVAINVLDEIKSSSIYQNAIKSPKDTGSDHCLKYLIRFAESNAERLLYDKCISDDEYWNIMIMINVHDTLKMHAVPGSSIESKYSHSSLARDFASEYFEDKDILNMIQYHDEPFALHRKKQKKSIHNQNRLDKLFGSIKNWNMFLMFVLSISCVPGSSRQPIKWLIYESNKRGVCDINKNVVIG